MKFPFIICAAILITSKSFGQAFCSNPKAQIHNLIKPHPSSSPKITKIQPHAIVAAVGGGFWATGVIHTDADKGDIMVAKFDDKGRLKLLQRVGTSGEETSNPIGIAPTASGGCVIGGRSDEPAIGAGLAALAYVNSNGSLKWWRRTTDKSNYGRYDAFRNVLVRKDGTVFGCGSSHQWNYNSQLLLAAVDSNGNEIFRNSYRYGSQTHMIASAEFDSGYIVAGHDGSSPVVLTVTPKGVVDKCFGYNSPNYCPIVSMVLSPSGKVYVTGGYANGSRYDLWVACINPANGNFYWQKKYSLDYTFGSKIDWINHRLMVSFNYNSGGSNWSNGFAELDSNGNVMNVKMVKFSTESFENQVSGINVATTPNGGWAFIGTNSSDGANMSISLFNPCDTGFCTVKPFSFNTISNTNVALTSNKGTMFYDGKFATNLTPFNKPLSYTETPLCNTCIGPVPTRFTDTVLCAGASLDYVISDTASQVLWSDGSTSYRKTFNSVGTYTVTLTNSCSTYRDTFEVKPLPKMSKVLPSQAFICSGETLNIIAEQPLNGSYSYVWEDGFNGAKRIISQNGWYILTTTDRCGFRKDTLKVDLKFGINPVALKDTFFCTEPNLFIQRIPDYTLEVRWFDGDTSHIKSFYNSGMYRVSLSNFCGSVQDTFEILRKTLPVKVLQDEAFYCDGAGVLISGEQFTQDSFHYLWNTGIKGPKITVRTPEILSLVTSNSCGTRTDEVRVSVANCNCEMCIPDAFTPGNSDGKNDEFKVRLDCASLRCLVKESYMRIYNRWGEKLHDAPITEAWNGYFQGKPVPEGNYIYLIHVVYDSQVFGNRIQTKSGVVTVLSGN
jgi:gliding motility-associated-like protein